MNRSERRDLNAARDLIRFDFWLLSRYLILANGPQLLARLNIGAKSKTPLRIK
jgi:hypothetical protein